MTADDRHTPETKEPRDRLGGCPQCGYARMSHVEAGLRCPECGLALMPGTVTIGSAPVVAAIDRSRRIWAILAVFWTLLVVIFFARGGVVAGVSMGVWVALITGTLWMFRRRDVREVEAGLPGLMLVVDDDGIVWWRRGRRRKTIPWSSVRGWSWKPFGASIAGSAVANTRVMSVWASRAPWPDQWACDLAPDDVATVLGAFESRVGDQRRGPVEDDGA